MTVTALQTEAQASLELQKPDDPFELLQAFTDWQNGVESSRTLRTRGEAPTPRESADMSTFKYQDLIREMTDMDDFASGEEFPMRVISGAYAHIANAAHAYLAEHHYSRRRLAAKLAADGFSDAEIDRVLHVMPVRWAEHALRSASAYAHKCAGGGMTKEWPVMIRPIPTDIVLYLEFQQFETDEIEYALMNVPVNWQFTADLNAQLYMDAFKAGPKEIVEFLRNCGFSDTHIIRTLRVVCG